MQCHFEMKKACRSRPLSPVSSSPSCLPPIIVLLNFPTASEFKFTLAVPRSAATQQALRLPACIEDEHTTTAGQLGSENSGKATGISFSLLIVPCFHLCRCRPLLGHCCPTASVLWYTLALLYFRPSLQGDGAVVFELYILLAARVKYCWLPPRPQTRKAQNSVRGRKPAAHASV